MANPYHNLLTSRPFQFLIGPDKKAFMVHSALVAPHSKPLDILINGDMLEAKEGRAFLNDVDEDTFVRFSQYAYTGDYDGAEPAILLDASMIQHDAASERAMPWPDANVDLPSPTPAVDSPDVAALEWDRDHSYAVAERVDDSFAGWNRFDTKKVKKKRTPLWQGFQTLTYPVATTRYEPRKNLEACEDYTEIFLAHARLYVFAERYLIDALKNLCLQKLQGVLAIFHLYQQRVGDVLELLRWTYAHTHDGDEMRRLVAHYAACNVETLVKGESLGDLLVGEGALGRDLVELLVRRLKES